MTTSVLAASTGNADYLPMASLSAFNLPRPNLVAVALKAYYDGSGKRSKRGADSRVIVLAGYVGTHAAWAAFEERWAAVLLHHRAPPLHMTDAMARRGKFAGWTASQVNALLEDLYDTCLGQNAMLDFRGQFYGAACAVNVADYDRVSPELPRLPGGRKKELEAICVDHVVGVAMAALPNDATRPFGKTGSVELYFDQGEKFFHKINRMWEARRSIRPQALQLVSQLSTVRRDVEPDVIGLQAADFLAWRTHYHYTNRDSDQLAVHSKAIFALLTTAFGVPCVTQYLDYERLKKEYGDAELHA